MKLVAYLRVSTEVQAEGLGLDVQKAAITEWAGVHDHELVAELTDAGISGSNGLEARTGLANALTVLRRDDAEGIVVYRLDRLARDLIIQEQLLAEARQHGWRVFSTSTSEAAYLEDDPGDPSRKMIRQVLGAVAEYERSMIALRLRSGRARKAQREVLQVAHRPTDMRRSMANLSTSPRNKRRFPGSGRCVARASP